MGRQVLIIACILILISKIHAQNPQPEYTSYESASGTDIVNLATGDFCFTLPLLTIPSPEGGVAVPISYHPGFSPDEEASWVGLGWSLNLGSINRDANLYPDDFNGQTVNYQTVNPGTTDYSKSWLVYTAYTYNNGKNRGGSINLFDFSYSWGANGRILDYMGVSYNFSTKKLSVDYVDCLVEVAKSIATQGTSKAVSGITDAVALQTTQSLVSVYQNAYKAANFASSLGIANGSYASNGYKYSQRTTPDWGLISSHFWFLGKSFLKTKIRTSYNSIINDKEFGALYLQNIDYSEKVSNGFNLSTSYYRGNSDKSLYGNDENYHSISELRHPGVYNQDPIPSHDCYLYAEDGENDNYAWSLNPADITYDTYNVMGEGISGQITPYRLEVGSLANPNYGERYINRYLPVKFLDYKVPFRYKGEPGNYYQHHGGQFGTLPISDYTSQMGLNFETDNGLHIRYMDQTLYEPTQRIDDEREGFRNYKISGGNYIEWYTNKEIKDGTAFINKNFVDYLPHDERVIARDAFIEHKILGTMVDKCGEHGIGGYSITRIDGYTFHYALPVYNLSNKTVSSTNLSNGTTTTQTTNNIHKYAQHWLLTAVTGPDYIDRNENNVVDPEDWGYWVKYDYSKNSDYTVRAPITGFSFSKDGKTRSYSEFTRENYYLKAVTTRTHVAFFVKSQREDVLNNGSLLKLDRIVLLKTNDYTDMLTTFGIQQIIQFEKGSPNANIKNYLQAHSLSSVEFNYSYSLCNGYKNGKLTLNGLSFLSKNDSRLVPGYYFEYSPNNPVFNSNNYDAWGAYKKNVNGINDRAVDSNGDEWCLTKIITPLGGTIEVTYERDDYSKVAEYDVGFNKKGGDLRVSKIEYSDNLDNSSNSRFIYTLNGTEGGVSSGVCSKEPELVRSNIPLYGLSKKTSLYDYPFTPVIYGKVTILKGNNNSIKEVYNFITPNSSMINCTAQQIMDQRWSESSESKWTVKAFNYVVDIQTNQIGAVESVAKYFNNMLLEKTEYSYQNSHNDKGGIYTEGSFLDEFASVSMYANDWAYRRSFRTTKVYHPFMLNSIKVTTPNGSSTVKNTSFDIITGNVTQSEIENSNGTKFRTSTLSAYKIYPEMGLKVENPANKNMITQVASTFDEKYIEDVWSPISASVQTWNNTWIYRHFNDVNNQYFDRRPISDVWRKHKTFVWKGEVNPDGSYKNFPSSSTPDRIITNWTTLFGGDGTEGWVKTSEVTRYNHYSLPLESMDINGNYAATKMGYNNSLVLATASNANYNSFAYTGFESESNTDWGSEFLGITGFTKIKGTVARPAHAGEYYGSLTGTTGPVFTATVGGTGGLLPNRTYKAMVWIHKDSPKTARLVIKTMNGDVPVKSESKTLENPDNKIFGDWILVTQTLDKAYVLPGYTLSTYVYIENGSAVLPVLIDDQRLQPIDAAVTAYAYDDAGNVTAILDNNNFAAKFIYDDAGRLISTYKETPQGFKKISENRYNYKRSNYFINFNYTPLNPKVGDVVTFTAEDAGTDATYAWDLGDGTVIPADKNKRIVTHSYSTLLYNFPVTLTVKAADNKTESVTKKLEMNYIRFTNPKSGDVYYPGSSLAVIWSSNIAGTFTIYYVHPGSSTAYTLKTDAKAGENFIWNISDASPATGYKIRIKSNETNYTFDSDPFEIKQGTAPNPTPSNVITILSPTGSDVWRIGQTYTVSWQCERSGLYNIKLVSADGGTAVNRDFGSAGVTFDQANNCYKGSASITLYSGDIRAGYFGISVISQADNTKTGSVRFKIE